MEEHKRSIIKLITLGDSSVGKTSIIKRFADGTFSLDVSSTLGVDFETKKLRIEGEEVHLTLFDTAGQERFRTLTRAFYQNCHGVLLVFSVGSKESFTSLGKWMESIKNNASSNIVVFLVGNKCDLEPRQIYKEEAEAFAYEYGISYYECSAKLNYNIEEMIMKLVTDISHIAIRKPKMELPLSRGDTTKKKEHCC